MQLVRESGSLYNTPNNQLGYGIPDFEQALMAGKVLESLKNEDAEAVHVFPNPVTDKLIVNYASKTSDAVGYLYSVLGKQVDTFFLSEGNNEINMLALNKGVYILKVDTPSGQEVFKIVKR